MCDTSVFGTMTLTHAIVPHMKRQRRGAIMMINTQATRKPFAGEARYAVSMGNAGGCGKILGANSACRVFARRHSNGLEWGGADADVLPGRGCHREMAEKKISRSCRPTTAARPALFLASNCENAVTGAMLDANGGDFMR